jgi:hypothetical protein
MIAPLVQVVLAYLSQGWSVIPLLPKSKRPALRWQDYQHRRAAPEEVRDANVGVITGKVSDLVVLDIDPQHGGDRSLERLIRGRGAIPETVEAATGGGGRHLYFAHPGGFVHNRVGLAPGIDLRGDGGYVVAPPSIHPSGRPYVWVPSREPNGAPLAPFPGWLLDGGSREGAHGGHSRHYWRRLVHDGVAEGTRNNTIASLAGHLLGHGIDPNVTMELLLCWNEVRCRPPLTEEEVIRTVESITHLHLSQTKDDPASPEADE